MTPSVVIGLSAVVVAIQDNEVVVLTVRPRDQLAGLPFGPFNPDGHRTFELALRAFVNDQTRFDLGYVEQLYTFGDKGRDAPLADMGSGAARVISVGYLGLTPAAVDTHAPDTAWAACSRFFPYEDWREGRPEALSTLEPALRAWAVSGEQLARARLLFALDGATWNEERVLERYELLYEAGLAPEAARDRGEPALPMPLAQALGERLDLAGELGNLSDKALGAAEARMVSSTLARSRISVSNVFRCSAPLRISPAISRNRGCSSLASISSAKPRMLVSGVRSSCEIAARNSLLAWLALLA